MSRPIKFRVWDKDYKEMHVCGENIHDSISFHEDGTAYYYNLQNGEGSGEHGAYILMEYIGIGNLDIWEGDIFEYERITAYDFTPKYERGVIEYSENGEWVVNGKLLCRLLNRGKVIGNIHAHPHLLGDDKDGQ